MTRLPVFDGHHADFDRHTINCPVGHATTFTGARRILSRHYRGTGASLSGLVITEKLGVWGYFDEATPITADLKGGAR